MYNMFMENVRNLIKFAGFEDVTLVSTWERNQEFKKEFDLTENYIRQFQHNDDVFGVKLNKD